MPEQPSWQPDPTGRNQLRWWDGSGWTDDVANQGVAARDEFVASSAAIAPPPPPPPTAAPSATAALSSQPLANAATPSQAAVPGGGSKLVKDQKVLIVGFVGVAVVIVAMLLGWLNFTVSASGIPRHKSFHLNEVTVQNLFDIMDTANDPSVLVLLIPALILASIGLLWADARAKILLIIGGLIPVAVGGLYLIQFHSRRSDIDALYTTACSNANATCSLGTGIAPYLCIAGGVLIIAAVFLRKSQPQMPAS